MVTFETPEIVRYVGFVDPAYPVDFLNPDGSTVSLAGVSTSDLGMTFQRISDGYTREGTGTWSINGNQANYMFSPADVAGPGMYWLYPSINSRGFSPDLIIIYPYPGVSNMATQDVNIIQVGGATISNGNPVPVAGPVTAVDGGNVALGATADAAWSGTGSATAIASLKGIYNLLREIVATTPVAFSGTPPTATNAGSNTVINLASVASEVFIQNNSAEDIKFNFDAAATAGSKVLKSGTGIWWNKPVATSINLLTTSAININGTAANNIIVEAHS